MLYTRIKIFFSIRGYCLEEYTLQVRHKQDWGRGFIILTTQVAVWPRSNASSDGIVPALGFVIWNHQTSCSYGGQCMEHVVKI